MTQPQTRRQLSWPLLALAAAVLTAANLGIWAFSQARAGGAPVQPVTLRDFYVFGHDQTFTIAVKKSNGANFGANPTASINIKQVINGNMVVTPWTNATVTKFAADPSIIGIRATAKRGVGSTPPLTGTIQITITDGGNVVSNPIDVTELPSFDPCPSLEVAPTSKP